MRDLLPDNMALAEKLEALPVCLGQTQKGAEQREVGSLLTWVTTFLTYVAVMYEVHPERVVDMLAYARLIIWEAHRHGGNGWLTYDADFRCNHQNVLDPSLHTAYVTGQGTPP